MSRVPPCKIGDRIELIKMEDDPCPIPPGSKGTIITDPVEFQDKWQITVDWDDDRFLSLVVPPDTFRILKKEDNASVAEKTL